MRAILIPVKGFAAAKQRLSPSYSEHARAALAEALCRDFFGVIARVRGVDRVYVVSNEPLALAWATQRGWHVIAEQQQVSETRSVDAASRICADHGVTSLLRLPADIPLVEPDDVEALFAAAPAAPGCVIVPSGEGTGTNALLRSPPALFPSHFGPGSFALHKAEAERAGAAIRILHNPRLALDIDEPADIAALADRVRPGSATAAWLREHASQAEQSAV